MSRESMEWSQLPSTSNAATTAGTSTTELHKQNHQLETEIQLLRRKYVDIEKQNAALKKTVECLEKDRCDKQNKLSTQQFQNDKSTSAVQLKKASGSEKLNKTNKTPDKLNDSYLPNPIFMQTKIQTDETVKRLTEQLEQTKLQLRTEISKHQTQKDRVSELNKYIRQLEDKLTQTQFRERRNGGSGGSGSGGQRENAPSRKIADRLETENHEIKRKLSSEKNHNSNLSAKLKTVTDKLNKREFELESAYQEIDAHKDEIGQLKHIKESSDRKITSLEYLRLTENEFLHKKLIDIEMQTEALEQTVESLEQERDEHKKNLEYKCIENDKSNDQIQKLTEELTKAKTLLKDRQNEIQFMRNEASNLRQLKQNSDNKIATLQYQMQWLNQHQQQQLNLTLTRAQISQAQFQQEQQVLQSQSQVQFQQDQDQDHREQLSPQYPNNRNPNVRRF